MGVVNPIKYKNQVTEREDAVHDKLLTIRDAQEMFRAKHDKFAPDFDTLKTVLKNDQLVSVNRVTLDTTRVAILDSLFKGDVSQVNELDKVPFSESTFTLDAGVLPSPSDSTLFVPVFEASTNTSQFLDGVNPDYWERDKKVKVGSMTAPITSGNWE